MGDIEKYIENPTVENLQAIATITCKKKQLMLKFIRTLVKNIHQYANTSMIVWNNKISAYWYINWALYNGRNLYFELMDDYTRVYVSKHATNVQHNRYISLNYFGNILCSKNWESYIPLMQNHYYVMNNYKFTIDELKIIEKIPNLASNFSIYGRNPDDILYILKNIHKDQIQDLFLNLETAFIAATHGFINDDKLLTIIIGNCIRSGKIHSFIYV